MKQTSAYGMKARVCAFGNCLNDEVIVTLNYRNQDKPAFCSVEHAALWLLRRTGTGRSHPDLVKRVEKMLGEDVSITREEATQ